MSSITQKFLPPSSASFHYFEKTASQALNRLEASSRALDEKLSLIEEKLSLIDEKSSILQKQISIYSEVALKDNKEETSFDTRVRLFSLLPEATGQLRKCQKATSKLMKALDEILDKVGNFLKKCGFVNTNPVFGTYEFRESYIYVNEAAKKYIFDNDEYKRIYEENAPKIRPNKSQESNEGGNSNGQIC